MASRTVTEHADDFDGATDGMATVAFAPHGAASEISLTQDDQAKLDAALERFLSLAREAIATSVSSSRRGRAASGAGAGRRERASGGLPVSELSA